MNSRKLKDRDSKTIFCTGTDEHGMKVQQAAQKAGGCMSQMKLS